jgi:hypothetical protein
MDFGKIVDKAKEWAGENPEKADGFVDKGSDFVKGHAGGHEEQVDQFGDKAKDFLHGQGGHEGQPGEQPPPPQQ